MLKVGSKFYTFEELSRCLEEFQKGEQVQLWVRDSRTVIAAAKRARRKSLNPALKYAELTYSCVFGGRRPSDQTKTHNQTSAGGCPFKVRLSTSNDGQALVVKEICFEHNHEPGKKLHDEPRRLYKKATNKTPARKNVRYIVNKKSSSLSPSSTNLPVRNRPEVTDSPLQITPNPFHNLKLHEQQYHQQQQIKLQQQQLQLQQQHQQLQLQETTKITTTIHPSDIIQLDSPDHIDTPDHLGSPDLSITFETAESLNNSPTVDYYLPPSPISPSNSVSSNEQTGESDEEENLDPILDLDEALEEALGDLDSVGSMDMEDPIRLSCASLLPKSSHVQEEEVPGCGPPAKRPRIARARKQSFSNNNNNNAFDGSMDIPGLGFSVSDLMNFDVTLF